MPSAKISIQRLILMINKVNEFHRQLFAWENLQVPIRENNNHNIINFDKFISTLNVSILGNSNNNKKVSTNYAVCTTKNILVLINAKICKSIGYKTYNFCPFSGWKMFLMSLLDVIFLKRIYSFDNLFRTIETKI